LLRLLDAPAVLREDKQGNEREVPASAGVMVPVEVVDARTRYGREDVLVRPYRGRGSAWVEANERVVLVEEWPEEATDEPQPKEGLEG
jgi:hypothetical protein